MQFTTLVSRQLTSSVASISKVAAFALQHAQKCSDDIWDCYLDEIGAVSLNGRVNLLYLLDALLDKEGPKLVTRGAAGSVVGQGSYRALAERDLGRVVAHAVPESREGVLNWMSTYQVRPRLAIISREAWCLISTFDCSSCDPGDSDDYSILRFSSRSSPNSTNEKQGETRRAGPAHILYELLIRPKATVYMRSLLPARRRHSRAFRETTFCAG